VAEIVPLTAFTAPESGAGVTGAEELEELLASGVRDGSIGAPHVSQ
jgi:hypothetical protein